MNWIVEKDLPRLRFQSQSGFAVFHVKAEAVVIKTFRLEQRFAHRNQFVFRTGVLIIQCSVFQRAER